MTMGIGPSTPVVSQTTSDSRTQGVSATKAVQGQNTAPSSSSSKPSSQLSTLAQQLSDSALRAEERDASLDRKALGQKADALLSQSFGTFIFTGQNMMLKYLTPMIPNYWKEQNKPPHLSAAEVATPLAATSIGYL
ncbi:hypothetical protein CZ787_15285 [Halomonas citrativorans]|uniref:Uncharacterized protein n=1 Tax=Halomonas citrativorans TaxID=2742612 RepID=A0A1R4I421_9GAMM|nr:hypothetical protein [Halomonas citrativorans]SJN14466.1 hypothetical protein CZ787_15285 [Halomonas citrativorans]